MWIMELSFKDGTITKSKNKGKTSTQEKLTLFRNNSITLTIVHQHDQTLYHLTELNQLQTTILELLDFSINIYTRLAAKFEKPG